MSNNSLKLLLDSLSTPILYLQTNQKIITINGAAEELLGISDRRATDKYLDEIIHCDPVQTAIKSAISTQESIIINSLETHLINRDVIQLSYTINPVFDNDQCTALSIELTPIEERLRLIRDSYLKNQQEASHETLKGLAHEIKNPLSGIRGAAQLLELEVNNPELSEYTQIIIAEVDRLHSLVSRLLHPTEVQSTQTLNIHEILEYVRMLVSAGFDENIEVLRDYDPSIPEVHGNRDQLTQVFLNILGNSLQAVKNKGHIQIVTRVMRQYTINNTRHRLIVKVDIIDDGPGIPEKLKDKLFFPMVSGSAEGTGLGLSIAQSLMSQHKGTIEFESEPGRTCFSILIPVE